jgi:hypothetical protein
MTTAVKPDPKRLEIAKSLPLARGSHEAPNEAFEPGEACLLEREAWIWGEKWGACPPCVSRVLWNFGQRLNDRLGDEHREAALELFEQLIDPKAAVAE